MPASYQSPTFRLLFAGLAMSLLWSSSASAQERAKETTWFTEAPRKTSRGGHRLPVNPPGLVYSTSSLLTQPIEKLPKLSVRIYKTSPFDLALLEEKLSAEALLDLSVVELTEFPIDTRGQ